MFGRKNALLLAEAEARIKIMQEKQDWYQRHYEKQQEYIEDLYNIIADMSQQLGMALNSDSMERLKSHPNLQNNSDFFLDLHLLFSTKLKKGRNITCYFGKQLDELQRRFQDRDFKNSKIVYLMERLPLGSLRLLIRDGLWKRGLEDVVRSIRNERGLDRHQ